MISTRKEWSWHVISIVACCHSVKLYVYAARAFRSQQSEPGLLPAWDSRRAKSFPRGAQNCWTMSNSFKLYPAHFSRGEKKFVGGLCPSWLRAWLEQEELLDIPAFAKTASCEQSNNYETQIQIPSIKIYFAMDPIFVPCFSNSYQRL